MPESPSRGDDRPNMPAPIADQCKKISAYHRLWEAFSYMGNWGLPGCEKLDAQLGEDRREFFAKLIRSKGLFRYVEDCKRVALEVGCELSEEAFLDPTAATLQRDGTLTEDDRLRLFWLTKQLHYRCSKAMDSLGTAAESAATVHAQVATGVAMVGGTATGESNGAGPNRQELHPAVYLGGGLLQIGTVPLRLQGQEELVIEALVDLRAATKKELETKSGVADAVTVLRRIRETHPCLKDHIILPGKKNAGGYRTTISRPIPEL